LYIGRPRERVWFKKYYLRREEEFRRENEEVIGFGIGSYIDVHDASRGAA
jgi:hypothetical protein